MYIKIKNVNVESTYSSDIFFKNTMALKYFTELAKLLEIEPKVENFTNKN